jgi:hypothetical protein
LILAESYPNDKRRALYASDTGDERLEDSDDDGPNDSDDEHLEAQNNSDEEEHAGDPNDSDDDDHLEVIGLLKMNRERIPKARKQGNGSGALA